MQIRSSFTSCCGGMALIMSVSWNATTRVLTPATKVLVWLQNDGVGISNA